MKVISCNIEGHKHLVDKVVPFLLSEQPDVICLQEVFAVDLPQLKQELQMDGRFVPMALVNEVSKHQSHALGDWGLAVLTKSQAAFDHQYYYTVPNVKLPRFFQDDEPNSMNRAVLWTSARDQDGGVYTVATTHFTWSRMGAYTVEQQRDFEEMKQVLVQLPPHILCGDFNSPRNNPHIFEFENQATLPSHKLPLSGDNVFEQLAKLYQDNIPPTETSSIDENIHKAGKIELMVDGFFSQPEHQVKSCRLVAGISDHKAVVAEISLRSSV